MGHKCKHRLAVALYYRSLQGGPNMTLLETMHCPVCHKLAPIQKTDTHNGIAPHLAPCGALCMFGQHNWLDKKDRIVSTHVHGNKGKCPRCGNVKNI